MGGEAPSKRLKGETATMEQSLAGRRIALPESRELDVLARLVESRGAQAVRCPLVSIRNNPDQGPVEAWVSRLIAGRMDHLILYTGEGLRRLLPVAEGLGVRGPFVEALGAVPVTARGPKPTRELRQLGLQPDHVPAEATTEGVKACLADLDLAGDRVGVQLYGTEPNEALMVFLREAGAIPDPVAPYVYASDVETDRVRSLIDELEGGQVDAIAFTSRQQVERLFRVGRQSAGEEALRAALARVLVASVGPVVAEALRERGAAPDVDPGSSYFMKPLVRAIEQRLGPA